MKRLLKRRTPVKTNRRSSFRESVHPFLESLGTLQFLGINLPEPIRYSNHDLGIGGCCFRPEQMNAVDSPPIFRPIVECPGFIPDIRIKRIFSPKLPDKKLPAVFGNRHRPAGIPVKNIYQQFIGRRLAAVCLRDRIEVIGPELALFGRQSDGLILPPDVFSVDPE